ncbi:unnamed protein product [Umbelopsis vinacea]
MVTAKAVLYIQEICVFLTFLIWCATLVHMRVAQRRNGYDNKNPRKVNETLEGWGARAVASNANTFEAFVFFVAATTMNMFAARKDDGPVAISTVVFSVIFLASRLVYPFLYHFDLDAARSGTWSLGMASVFAIFILSLIH